MFRMTSISPLIVCCLIVSVSAQESTPVAEPQDAASPVAADFGPEESVESLTGKVTSLEERSRELVTEVRALKTQPNVSEDEQSAAHERLRAVVENQFHAQQNLDRAELGELRERLDRIRRSIEQRDEMATAIIAKRMESLLTLKNISTDVPDSRPASAASDAVPTAPSLLPIVVESVEAFDLALGDVNISSMKRTARFNVPIGTTTFLRLKNAGDSREDEVELSIRCGRPTKTVQQLTIKISDTDVRHITANNRVTKVFYRDEDSGKVEQTVSIRSDPAVDLEKSAAERGPVIAVVGLMKKPAKYAKIADPSELDGLWEAVSVTSIRNGHQHTPNLLSGTSFLKIRGDQRWQIRNDGSRYEESVKYDLRTIPQRANVSGGYNGPQAKWQEIFELDRDKLLIARGTTDVAPISFGSDRIKIIEYRRAASDREPIPLVIRSVTDGLVTIPIAGDLNIEIGQQLDVYSGDERTAVLEVVEVAPDSCVARIIEPTEDREILKGHQVRFVRP